MSLLDKSSLVVTPNAVKAGKLYSVIPNTTLGDMDVVRATTTTRVNSAGLIENVAVNVARLDYANASCPSILIEPQRTNLLTYSNTFSNAAWIKSSATITANSIISPDGTQNASKLNVTAVAFSGIYQAGNAVSSKYTTSVFVKKGTKDWFYLVNLSGTTVVAYFNISNGTLGTVVNGTAKIENYGNGWYKCSYSDTNNITNTFFQLGFSDANNSSVPTSSGDGYIYGAQNEEGSFLTSYIPTVASTVTRNGDNITKTLISSLIGQTQGTLFLEANIQKRNLSDFYIGISAGGLLAESIYLVQSASGSLSILVRSSGTTVTLTVLNTNWTVGNNKIAIAYTATNAEVYINGISKTTATITNLPACNQLTIGSRLDVPGTLVGAGNYKSAQLYKTRLSNSELAQLTTL